ncbi:capsule biosynthesis protein [Sphingorhabdus arenilitoris]|uniref:Capsule biosynthesis protein n=1 Tax=Sphingorhabdus arenilitoris TaxID=1490041 RepID=A0ABV8RE45_9SPHN
MKRKLPEFVTRPRNRWIVYTIAAITLAILCVFPQPYLARAKILPQDNSSTGINAVLNSLAGQDGVFATFLSNRQAIDLYLAIARSSEIQDSVIKQLKLVGPGQPYSNAYDAKQDLQDKVTINSLTGGLIQIEVLSHDRNETEKLAQIYASAISDRIRSLGREQLSIKQNIVRERFGEATKRISDAETALENFRQRNKLSSNPDAELGAALSARAGVEAQIKATQVKIQTLQQFAGPENIDLISAQEELKALQQQLAGLGKPSVSAGIPNAVALTRTSNEYLALFRDYKYAQALYDIYSRFAEQIEVEELSSTTVANVQVVEKAHLQPGRQYNLPAIVLLLTLFLFVFFVEIYGPATGLWRNTKKHEPHDTHA